MFVTQKGIVIVKCLLKKIKIMNQAKYTHYKNKKEYIVLCYGFLESDLTQMVVYQSVLDKQVWIRPVDEFEIKFTLVDKDNLSP